MAKVVADLVDQVAVDGTAQAHGHAWAAVLRRHHLAAVVGHSGGPVMVVVAVAARAREAVDGNALAVEAAVNVVAVAAAQVGVGEALHAALRVVDVGGVEVGVGHGQLMCHARQQTRVKYFV